MSPDPFATLQEETRLHRASHGCGAYTYSDGRFPATIAAALGARRIVEVGTALGYTAVSMAEAAPGAIVETIEQDATHVALARAAIGRLRLERRVHVLHGAAEAILEGLDQSAYDLAFFDGFAPTDTLVDLLATRLRQGGTLLCANIGLDGVGPDVLSNHGWRACQVGDTAIAVLAS